MLEGLSIPRYLKLSDNALGADNQQERPAGITDSQGFGKGATSSRAVNGGKISRASAPEVELLILLESSETICQIPIQIGKDIVRTAWRHAEDGRNVHSVSHSCKCGVVTESSEIPCRVSSDLHEWRNESATVLPTDTANL